MSELDDVVRDFLVESVEGLDRLDQDFVALEQNPADAARIASIFRCVHTIKGTCGFLGFSTLESVAHAGENLLVKLRDGELLLTTEMASVLLAVVDAIRGMIGSIEASGHDGGGDYSELLERLRCLQQPATAEVTAEAAPVAGSPAAIEEVPGKKTSRQARAARNAARVRARLDAAPEAPAVEPPVMVEAAPSASVAAINRPAPSPPAAVDPPAPVAALPPTEPAAPAEPGRATGGNPAVSPAGESPDSRSSSVADSTLRVDIGLLDRLMNLVGELVLARNQILQHTATQRDPAFTATSARLNLITTELQEGVMKTRMQPIGNIWNKLPRVVRDLATAGAKQAGLEMEGKETELDKTIIEAIKDPLTHLVRNSVDHGLESPQRRVELGKPAEGTVRLRAYHEGGQVNIEISDDGAGIDVERVRHKAVHKGMITSEQAARMNERDLLNLIFLPGFSTAEKVTNVSGRGVGMDVVKTNVEKIGGTVDVHSVLGVGTTFKIKIPLTLAIIPALIVSTRGQRYAIPQVSLLELVRLGGEQARKSLEEIHGAPVYRLRGRLLPLVYLSEALRLPRQSGGAASESVNIVVLRADDRQFGLVVDAVNDSEEIVVKPLGWHLKGISTFAGATIMGDGTVALILDVLGLAQATDVISGGRESNATDPAEVLEFSAAGRQTVLIAGVGEGRRVAIPLGEVARLEEFPLDRLERSAGQEVIQYRGHIMPIVRVADVLGVAGANHESDAVQVVVHSVGDRMFGLAVDTIVDIVEETITRESCQSRPGIAGAAVIQGRVTDLLDLNTVIHLAGFEPELEAAGI